MQYRWKHTQRAGVCITNGSMRSMKVMHYKWEHAQHEGHALYVGMHAVCGNTNHCGCFFGSFMDFTAEFKRIQKSAVLASNNLKCHAASVRRKSQ